MNWWLFSIGILLIFLSGWVAGVRTLESFYRSHPDEAPGRGEEP